MSKFYTNVQAYGNHILYRGIENGQRVGGKVPYKPTLYVLSKKPKGAFRTLKGQALDAMPFDSINDAKDFCKRYDATPDFPIYGNQGWGYAFISEKFPEVIEFEPEHVRVAFVDIEVSSEHGFPNVDHASAPITAITLYVDGLYHVWGTRPYTSVRDDVIYHYFETEVAMLEDFFQFWHDNCPDIITGWNVELFDIPYLVNRCKTLFMPELANKLSPWDVKHAIKERDVAYGTKRNHFYSILGVSIIEYIDLFKKYSKNPNQESYSLENISQVTLGEGKETYEGTLWELYRDDFPKFIRYNIRDVELVRKIDEKLGLMALVVMLAYANKVNYEDVFMQVRMWDSICYDFLRRKGIIVPPKEQKIKSRNNEGAYVKSPITGRYEWGASFDLDGLYPHLIMMYNISPETLVEDDDLPHEVAEWKDKNLIGLSAMDAVTLFVNGGLPTALLSKYNLTVTPNGAVYRKDIHGFLPQIMETKYAERKKYKNMMLEAKKALEAETDSTRRKDLEKRIAKYDNWQSALKITLNSAYGAIANEWFRMYDMRNAEAITLSGRLAVFWIEGKLNAFLNGLLKTSGTDYIVAIDTDSVYINLGAIVSRAYAGKPAREIVDPLDKFLEKHVQGLIGKSYNELYVYTNAYADKMNMKRESIYDSAFWTAKKRYVLNVWDQEGVRYEEPKLKITGMEAIKSSTPKIAREGLKNAYSIILANDLAGLRDFVSDFRNQFRNLPCVQIASPRSCNDLTGYADPRTIWGKGTPVHVRGALVYNHYLKGNGLEKKYELIKEGEKVRFMALKEPNPIQSDVISFVDKIPAELGVGPYLDYEKQFQKVFVDPLEIVLDAVGWKLEEESTLEGLFE